MTSQALEVALATTSDVQGSEVLDKPSIVQPCTQKGLSCAPPMLLYQANMPMATEFDAIQLEFIDQRYFTDGNGSCRHAFDRRPREVSRGQCASADRKDMKM